MLTEVICNKIIVFIHERTVAMKRTNVLTLFVSSSAMELSDSLSAFNSLLNTLNESL